MEMIAFWGTRPGILASCPHKRSEPERFRAWRRLAQAVSLSLSPSLLASFADRASEAQAGTMFSIAMRLVLPFRTVLVFWVFISLHFTSTANRSPPAVPRTEATHPGVRSVAG